MAFRVEEHSDTETIKDGLHKRMGFEELSEENGIVSMRIDLSKMN